MVSFDELYFTVHKLCRLKGGGGGGQKLPNLLSKKMNKKGEGVKNCQFWDVMDGP